MEKDCKVYHDVSRWYKSIFHEHTDKSILKCGGSCLGVAQTVEFSIKTNGIENNLGGFLGFFGILEFVNSFRVQKFVTERWQGIMWNGVKHEQLIQKNNMIWDSGSDQSHIVLGFSVVVPIELLRMWIYFLNIYKSDLLLCNFDWH